MKTIFFLKIHKLTNRKILETLTSSLVIIPSFLFFCPLSLSSPRPPPHTSPLSSLGNSHTFSHPALSPTARVLFVLLSLLCRRCIYRAAPCYWSLACHSSLLLTFSLFLFFLPSPSLFLLFLSSPFLFSFPPLTFSLFTLLALFLPSFLPLSPSIHSRPACSLPSLFSPLLSWLLYRFSQKL